MTYTLSKVRTVFSATTLIAGMLLMAPGVSLAADMKHGHKMHGKNMSGKTLSAENPWVPVAPPSTRVHAAYLLLKNNTGSPRSLVAASSPQYGQVEIHMSRISDGVAAMHKMAQVKIPGDGSVAFKPGGLHFMLMQPKENLKAGDVIDLVLKFDDGSTLALKPEVRKRGGNEMPSHHHNGHHHGGGHGS